MTKPNVKHYVKTYGTWRKILNTQKAMMMPAVDCLEPVTFHVKMFNGVTIYSKAVVTENWQARSHSAT